MNVLETIRTIQLVPLIVLDDAKDAPCFAPGSGKRRHSDCRSHFPHRGGRRNHTKNEQRST